MIDLMEVLIVGWLYNRGQIVEERVWVYTQGVRNGRGDRSASLPRVRRSFFIR